MVIDVTHNKVLKSSLTEGFIQSMKQSLCPALAEKYGDGFEGVQMYEDYIADEFSFRGYWYYPFTILLRSTYLTQWAKWKYPFPSGSSQIDPISSPL